MVGKGIHPSPALLKILKSWPGGSIHVRKNENLKNRLDVILDRPEKNNCLSGTMMLQFGEKSEKFEDPNNGIIVITGIGKSFCSGADLGLIKDTSDQNLGIEMFDFMSSILNRIHQSGAISIAKIHGHALGGATEICSSADIRIAHSKSKIAFFQSKMGIVPSWGGAEYLENIMGRGKALSALTRANIMTAKEAKKLGWVDYVYENDEEADNFIESVASSGLNVTKAQKAMLNAVKIGKNAQKEILNDVWNGETHKKALKRQLDAVVKNK